MKMSLKWIIAKQVQLLAIKVSLSYPTRVKAPGQEVLIKDRTSEGQHPDAD
jgi:hypothetical protein